MVKITFETINSKIGKSGDPASFEEVSLANKQIDEVGSFAKFAKLKKLDLSNNRIRFKRHIEGLFLAPALEELDLRGNPVCAEAGYRAYMIEGIKTLKVLDGVSVDTPIEQKSTNQKKASNLFEDDDDDDLFNNNPLNNNNKAQVSNKPTATPAKVTENNVAKTSAVKEATIDATSDPLSNSTKVQENAPIVKPDPAPAKEEPKIIEKPKQVEAPIAAKKEEPKVVKEVPKPVPKVEPKEEAKQEQSAKSKPVVESTPAKVAEKPKEEPKPAEKPKSTTKSTETKTQSAPGVFKDSRTGLEISTKLSEGIQIAETQQEPEVELPQKEMLTEDSLFGAKKSVFQDNVKIDKSLLEMADEPQKKPVQKEPAAKKVVSVAIADDDDDDLFSTKPKPKSKSSAVNLSDDLFDLVSTKKNDNTDLSKLNIDDYIASQTGESDSLFD